MNPNPLHCNLRPPRPLLPILHASNLAEPNSGAVGTGVTENRRRRYGSSQLPRHSRLTALKNPYASAPRVFWIVDNGSSHRGQESVRRLEGRRSNLKLVHAGWVNQVEIFFSTVQRKGLTRNDLDEVRDRLRCFE